MKLDLPRPEFGDSVAGASVALVLIPQSLAYAELAGLPPYIGLFAAAFPLLVFSLFASSPFLQTGPTAMMSLLTFAALSPDDPADLAEQAALLALMVGGLRFVFGVMRIGAVVRAIGLAVVTGFTAGAAVLIIASQLPRALGVDGGDGTVLAEAAGALASPGQWQLSAIVLTALTLVLFLGGRKLHPLVPGVLIAVVMGVVWSRLSGYEGSTVMSVPEGLPDFSFELPWGEAPGLLLGAIVIALIGFAEPVSIARAFANEAGQSWDANRELMASGLANATAAIAGAYPIGGSFSRSSVNKLAGATTRWSGGITGLVVLAFLPFAGILEPLPRAVLSAIVLGAAIGLIKPRILGQLAERCPEQALIAVATFAATLVFAPRVERAVFVGIAATVIVHLRGRFRIDEHADAAGAVLTPSGMLWLGTDSRFAQVLERASGATDRVTVDLGAVPFVDDATVTALAATGETMAARGARLEWANPPLGSERVLATLRDTIDSR